MFVSQWLLRRWRESEGHLCPRWLLCGNSTLPSVSPLMAPLPSSLHHGCRLFEHQPPKVNYRHPIPPSSLFTPHTHTLSKTPPSSQCAESTLVQEGCSCFRGPGSALLGRLCLEVGVREAAAFTRQRGLFKKKKNRGRRKRKGGWMNSQGQVCQLLWTQRKPMITITSLTFPQTCTVLHFYLIKYQKETAKLRLSGCLSHRLADAQHPR